MPDIFDRVLELNRLTSLTLDHTLQPNPCNAKNTAEQAHLPQHSESGSHAGSTHCIRTGVFTVSRTRDCEQPPEWQ